MRQVLKLLIINSRKKEIQMSNSVSTGTGKIALKKFDLQRFGVLPVLIIFCIMFSLLEPRFLSVNNITNIFRQAAVNIIIASGMTLVILTGGIDLSVGSILAVSSVVAVQVSLSPLAALAVPIGLVIGLFAGLINGFLVSFFKMPPFIATLGMMTSLRGAAYLLSDGTTVINNDLNFAWIGNNNLGIVPWQVFFAIFIIAITWVLLKRTVIGMRIYAVGGNEKAAVYSGISVASVILLVHGLSGLFSGFAGVVMASRLYSASGLLGISYELDAIAAVILGGTSFNGGIGGVGGTLIGALIISVLNNGLIIIGVPYFWQQVIKGMVIIVAVIIDIYRQKIKS